MPNRHARAGPGGPKIPGWGFSISGHSFDLISPVPAVLNGRSGSEARGRELHEREVRRRMRAGGGKKKKKEDFIFQMLPSGCCGSLKGWHLLPSFRSMAKLFVPLKPNCFTQENAGWFYFILCVCVINGHHFFFFGAKEIKDS